jgi:hypothetical protein
MLAEQRNIGNVWYQTVVRMGETRLENVFQIALKFI